VPRARRPLPPPLLDRTDPDGFGVTVAEFLEWMLVKNFSERTVGNRQLHLELLVDWLYERGIERPAEVTRPVLERYQRHLYHYRKKSGLPMSFMSQHGRLTSIRAFFRWLARQNRILYNPASELELPRLEKRLPRHVLTATEAELVLQQPELATLNLYDLDVERGTVVVRQGKGKRDRTVPVGERAIAWAQRYLDEVRPRLVSEPDDGTLFLTKDGDHFGGDLNRLSSLVRQYVDAAHLGKRGSCHLFRHTMATLMLEGGADIRYIQQMLGHAELSTTQIYTQVSIRRLKQVHTLTHPAANLRPRRVGEGLVAQEQDQDLAPSEEQLLLSLAAEAAEEEAQEAALALAPTA